MPVSENGEIINVLCKSKYPVRPTPIVIPTCVNGVWRISISCFIRTDWDACSDDVATIATGRRPRVPGAEVWTHGDRRPPRVGKTALQQHQQHSRDSYNHGGYEACVTPTCTIIGPFGGERTWRKL
jgi:hypothetical protein